MSKIHTSLKESAASAHSVSTAGKSVFSSLDEKLITAGVAPDILDETRSARTSNSGGCAGYS